MYVLRHPIPSNLAGLGDATSDMIAATLAPGIRQAIDDSWPTVEAKADALVQKYQQKFMIAGLVIGGLAVASMILTIKHELKV